jgi:hypothetical protein
MCGLGLVGRKEGDGDEGKGKGERGRGKGERGKGKGQRRREERRGEERRLG